ncbi:MAG TPA: NAD(P)/FAD-dependent oxidoreductase [Longimicrobiales bacterium]|nr:NAD(P)/FAD-dependent oxidoreductase [Longimicrobiales bacterium]
MTDYEAIVVGGGPAGITTGLWLARYRRKVLVLDSGRPRNDATWAVHGYPGIVDPPPHELRRILNDQAVAAGAEREAAIVVSIKGEKNDFNIMLEDDRCISARRVVLAYGRQDVLPEIEGLDELYGISVFHCPDCDGPSMLDQRVGVYGNDRSAAILALYLLTWAKKVTLLTDGYELNVKDEARKVVSHYGIDVVDNKIRCLCRDGDRLSAVEFNDGDALPLDGLFFHLGSHPSTDIAHHLGCERDEDGNLVVDNSHETSVPGIYGAGDLIGGPYLAVNAAANGAKTAIAVHKSLLPPELAI